MARNPFRSEDQMFKFLLVVIGGAVLIALGAWIDTWVGVGVAVVAVAGIVWWLLQEPTPGAAEQPPRLDSSTPAGMHRILVLAPPGSSSVRIPDAVTDVLVVVPALATPTESLTGAVDDRRSAAEETSRALVQALARDGRTIRGEVGADDPVLAVEDALRTFGADEVLVVGGDGIADAVRARVAVPVHDA
ncbi:MAG: hypothetical protein ABUS54_10590 [Actinomycetota bacterium]